VIIHLHGTPLAHTGKLQKLVVDFFLFGHPGDAEPLDRSFAPSHRRNTSYATSLIKRFLNLYAYAQ
jgi:hypothetical protein